MFSKRRGRSALNMVAIVRPSTWSFVGIPQSFVIRCISMVSSWGCLQCHSSTVWSGTSLKVPQSQPLISCTLFPNIFEIKSVKSRFEWNTELHRHVEEKVASLTCFWCSHEKNEMVIVLVQLPSTSWTLYSLFGYFETKIHPVSLFVIIRLSSQ